MEKIKNTDSIKDDYVKETQILYESLQVTINTQLRNLPMQGKFKVGTYCISLILSNFCYAMIGKNHPDKTFELLEDIKKTAFNLLEYEFSDKQKKGH
jgi:hypothetical protein